MAERRTFNPLGQGSTPWRPTTGQRGGQRRSHPFQIVPGQALVHGQAIAIFRTQDDQVYALGNHDPFAKASVLAKGIVGTRDGVPFVASPSHKHAFDLRTGRCLDDPHVSVPAYAVRVVDGIVQIGGRKAAAA